MLKKLLGHSAWKVALLFGLACATLHILDALGVVPLTFIDRLEAKAVDLKFRHRGPLPLSHQVALVEIDERATQRYGLWPWDRARIAELLQKTVDDGAASVGLDMIFSDPDRNSAFATLAAMRTRLPPADDALPAQAKEALEKLPPASKGEVSKVLDAALREHDALAQSEAALARATSRPPDDALRDAVEKNADKLVLGAISLQPADVAQGDPAALAAWKREVRASIIPEAFELSGATKKKIPPQSWSVSSDAAVEAWLPAIAGDDRHFATFSMSSDPDGVMRHYTPLHRLPDGFFPSLALATTALPSRWEPSALRSPAFPSGLEAVEVVGAGGKTLRLPVDPFDHSEMLINFAGARESWHSPDDRDASGQPVCSGATCDRFSAADVLDGKLAPKSLEGKIVFVGVTALGTFDQRITPFDNFDPGVFIHLNVAEELATGRFLDHGGPLAMLEALLLLVFALVFGLALPRVNIAAQFALTVIAALVYAWANGALFASGTDLFLVTPILELALLFALLVSYQYFVTDRDKRQVKTAFQYYLTESVMTEMLKDPSKLKLGGEKKELTVLFSDIRGFTTLSEMLEPGEVVRRLNEYLTPMTNLVFATGGTLDKYMGDAIMAFWGAPVDQPDHALRACETAVRMLAELHALRARWKEKGEADIDIGIGLNSGAIHVGNMGSDNRFDYTVIGDDVNLASRLEGTNKSYGTRVIIGENTFRKVQGKVIARELGGVMVKGKKKPVTIYELRGMGAAAGEEAQSIAAFERGLAAYRARDWNGAEAAFNEVLRAWPNDGPSEKYLEDIPEKRAHPPDAGWDGVYVMKTK